MPSREDTLKAWATEVRKANRHAAAVGLSERDVEVMRTVNRLAYATLAGVEGALDAVTERRLDRIIAAGKPRSMGEQIATAIRIIAIHAERAAPLTKHASERDLAALLVSALAGGVHQAFASVKIDDVTPWLSVYTNTKNRSGKLTAAGVLLKLNHAARWPLGKGLTANRIGNAVRQHR